MSVVVTRAFRAQEPVIQNLAQFYTHDFSEFWAGTAHGEVLPDGRFDPYPLERYWTLPQWAAFLVWHGDALAGFALINDAPHTGDPARNVGEFFILKKYRGMGAGRLAARWIFSQHPGWWEVAVARKNLAAQRFWRSIIVGAAPAGDLSELDLADDRWNGPVLRFRWMP
jgi:predicted acetyltransferase